VVVLALVAPKITVRLGALSVRMALKSTTPRRKPRNLQSAVQREISKVSKSTSSLDRSAVLLGMSAVKVSENGLSVTNPTGELVVPSL
jgi:hypothetical protein